MTAAVIIGSNADLTLTGISRIEITARTVKAWGADTFRPDPPYRLTGEYRKAFPATGGFLEMAEFIRRNAIREGRP